MWQLSWSQVAYLYIVLGLCLCMVLLLVNRHICIALTAGTNKHLVRHAIKQAEAAMTLRYGPMSDAQMQQAMQQVAARATNFPQQQ